MSFTPEEQKTINSYNSSAQAWAEAHDTSTYWSGKLATLKKLLPQDLEMASSKPKDDLAQLLCQSY